MKNQTKICDCWLNVGQCHCEDYKPKTDNNE